MAANKVTVMEVIDGDSGQQALAIVRAGEGYVALTLSLEREGDVQVVFKPSECEQLAATLRQAASLAGEKAAAV